MRDCGNGEGVLMLASVILPFLGRAVVDFLWGKVKSVL
eukprot:COSAG06_NODE_66758_length_253_cov_1.233766_1_plen_37_part_10